MSSTDDRTASLMTPAKLAQVQGAARAPVDATAFLDRMATDVGHQHLRRLSQLRSDLASSIRTAKEASALPAMHRLAEELEMLDFAPLKAGGWWAGLTGRRHTAGEAFAARFEEADRVAQGLVTTLGSVHKRQQALGASSERMLLEFEVEYRALDKIMDQGTRWLQDMRAQLRARGGDITGDPDVQRQLAQDGARCDLLLERLKLLRAVASAARQAHEELRAAAARRAGIMKAAVGALSGQVQGWRGRVGGLAALAPAGKAGRAAVDEAAQVHGQVLQRLHELLVEGAELKLQENACAQALAQLDEQLGAAGLAAPA
ncbi:MAG TPA: hypothetical protein VFE82_16855 [Ramlibacter sp.]|jgi:hypothetical protein|uniref:hypothetical protein n=1 Tax=Ramlibacter sp. TaxID=1917967 RepID=UPI002D44B495|nr:hypothetical protein [Ramlibacter sp.]HZY20142.1 hypothetical protein [Ramlibacter sp.]